MEAAIPTPKTVRSMTLVRASTTSRKNEFVKKPVKSRKNQSETYNNFPQEQMKPLTVKQTSYRQLLSSQPALQQNKVRKRPKRTSRTSTKMLPTKRIMRWTPTTRMKRKKKRVKRSHLRIRMMKQKSRKTNPQRMKTRTSLKTAQTHQKKLRTTKIRRTIRKMKRMTSSKMKKTRRMKSQMMRKRTEKKMKTTKRMMIEI